MADGSVRTGFDVMKLLALGARAAGVRAVRECVCAHDPNICFYAKRKSWGIVGRYDLRAHTTTLANVRATTKT